MQNDNMYSENQVFFEHTLWLEPDQKKDTREDTVQQSVEVLQKENMEQIVQYWSPKNGEGQDLELPQSNGHSKEKHILWTPEDVHSWTTWFSYSIKL